MKKILVSLCIVLFLLSGTAICQSLAADPEIESNIRLLESWIETKMDYDDIPGLAIGVVHESGTVWMRGFGTTERGGGDPVDTQTLFRIASISKLFTSIATLRLRDDGKLNLDDPVAKHLDWFRIRNSYPEAPPITIEHLLTHTSGLPREAAYPYWTDFEFPTREQIMQALPGQKTAYPSETIWKYSNLGLTIAGEVVQAASGVPYEDYVRKTILDPLGMNATLIHVKPGNPKLAAGYTRKMRDGTRTKTPFTDSKGLTPAANFSTCLDDFAKFASWQLRLRKNGGSEVLKATTLKEMQRVHWLFPSWAGGYGLGFSITHSEERDLIGHGGHVSGYRSRFTISPKENLAVFCMMTTDDGNPTEFIDMAYKLLAPAITNATAETAETSHADPAWRNYCGLYSDIWGDSEVMIYNGRLALVYPQSDDPLGSMLKLTPAGEHSFMIEGSGGAETGELLTFEMNADGSVRRMKLGENYTDKVK